MGDRECEKVWVGRCSSISADMFCFSFDPAMLAITSMGSLISRPHLAKVDSFVQQAKATGSSGLSCLTGGEALQTSPSSSYPFSNGSFYPPTVFSLPLDSHGGATNEEKMRKSDIWKQEVFGPVVVCCPFEDEEHAIELANDSEYSLGASVWTKDVSFGKRDPLPFS